MRVKHICRTGFGVPFPLILSLDTVKPAPHTAPYTALVSHGWRRRQFLRRGECVATDAAGRRRLRRLLPLPARCGKRILLAARHASHLRGGRRRSETASGARTSGVPGLCESTMFYKANTPSGCSSFLHWRRSRRTAASGTRACVSSSHSGFNVFVDSERT